MFVSRRASSGKGLVVQTLFSEEPWMNNLFGNHI
jgi:hypothetical protein